ncbi:MAG: hypothetical protein MI717_01145 [Spirochaetales bacterium]|nr:hypothetical protein [Spirochaetales bacterium]
MVGIPVSLWGGGSGEVQENFDPILALEEAEVLIDEGRLDEAIAALVDIARKDPEQIERVQDRILVIRGIKEQVNTLFEELNEAIMSGDEELADAKIREVKNVDASPNRNTLNNLILAAIVVGKARNDAIRDDFFQRGNQALARGDYTGAVDIYRQGFINDDYLEFYDDFIMLAQDQAEIVRYIDDPERQAKVWEAYGEVGPLGNLVIEELSVALDLWRDVSGDIPLLNSRVAQILETQGPEQWPEILNVLTTTIQDVQSRTDEGQRIASQLDRVRERMYSILDGIPEDFRYERIGQFMSGRATFDAEGILEAQSRQIQQSYTATESQLDERIMAFIAEGREAFAAENWDGAIEFFDLLVEAVLAAEQFSQGFDAPAQSYRYLAEGGGQTWAELSALYANLPRLDSVNYEVLGVEGIDTVANPVLEGTRRLRELLAEWNARVVASKERAEPQSAESVMLGRSVRNDINDAIEVFTDRRVNLYVNAVKPLYEALEEDIRQAINLNPEQVAQLFLAEAEPGEEIPLRRPSFAITNAIIPTLAALNGAEEDIGDFLDVMEEVLRREPPIEDPQQVRRYVDSGQALLGEVARFRDAYANLQSQAESQASEARRAIATAQNGLATAERDLLAAQAAVDQGRQQNDIDSFYRSIALYDAVDGSLDVVDRLYLDVLIKDADLAAQSGLDEQRAALRDRVQTDRSRVAVVVKQNAVDEGRNSYEDGYYSEGLAVLIQSQDFWVQAYGEEDPELDAWIMRLRNAQQALLQTVIAPEDPLYAEMNQYLNLANRYYAEGIEVAQNRPGTADALLAFRSSEELVLQVLNTFPGNEEALLLEQKILRQTDEEAWNAEARQVVTQSRRAVSINNLDELRGDERRKGLYAQLKVLEGIAPDFSGLAAVIYDVEVALGVIIPPPDPRVLAQSRDLANQATQIWDNLGRAGSDRAIELLDQALALWLENENASQLKNEILLSTEPQRLPPLPAELLNLLNFIEEYYAQANYILAQAFMDRVLTDYPRFANDPRVKEWQQKLEIRQ